MQRTSSTLTFPPRYRSTPYKHYDHRTRRDRTRRRNEAYARIMPDLIKRYLTWRHARERRKASGALDFEGIGGERKAATDDLVAPAMSMFVVDLQGKCKSYVT